ncbi:MAG TPA: hypothetical protein ENK62_02230 [Chromatiales bacterium]|nr:hypothetical protein [Chromatiales bacterium]
MPALAQRPDRLEAEHYNLWRRARRRLGSPIRLSLEGMHGVELILEDRAWVCVNTLQNDLPILAWVDFEESRRPGIHAPVPCRLNYYHFAASKYRAKALEVGMRELRRRIEERRWGRGAG